MNNKKNISQVLANIKNFNLSLNNKCFSVSSSNQTYRTIDVWTKAGLFEGLEVADSNGWKKFSMLDLIWVNIITQLRGFGLSLSILQTVKGHLRCISGKTMTEKWIYESKIWDIFQGDQIDLIVMSNGETYVIDHLEWEHIKNKYKINHFVYIDFSEIVRSLNKNIKIDTKQSLVISKPSKEFEVLQLIKKGDYESIEIIPKHGTIERYELTQKVKSNKRIVDIINEANYQTINIKRINGEIVSIKQIIQHK